MISREDARRIAETASMIRPDWLVSSLVTLLAEFRSRNPRDVHLALIWIAYDPETRTPARLREDGPWWHLEHQPGPPPLPLWKDPDRDRPRLTREQIQAIRQTAHNRQEKP